MTIPSLFWHDYETFGIDPRRDRPAQFAGVRTDIELNIIGDPIVIYCKPPLDYLPDPEACLLTGISPQIAEKKGVNESEFCRVIYSEFSQPFTCSLGYNTIRFDDEFTRNCLYRNFYDPYAREWQNGNSRWDLIDVVRAAKALRPDGINWPVEEDGRPSFKLQNLTQANGLSHEAAHDALSDVYATIALAKLIKAVQPKLFEYLWRHRTKKQVYDLLEFGRFKPVVHVSGRYSTLNQCAAVVLPVCRHPINSNGIVVYDLSIDPEPLLSLSIENIRQRIFTATADLPEGIQRIPLKTVHTNKCPVLAPISVLRPDDLLRLNINLDRCYENIERIKAFNGLSEKLASVFSKNELMETEVDSDLAIYSGGFFSESDKQIMAKIRRMPPDQLDDYSPNFSDQRFKEMFFRYRARNFPEFLQPDEVIEWRTFCLNRITGAQSGGGITLERYLSHLSLLRTNGSANLSIINDLEAFALDKMQNLKMPAN